MLAQLELFERIRRLDPAGRVHISTETPAPLPALPAPRGRGELAGHVRQAVALGDGWTAARALVAAGEPPGRLAAYAFREAGVTQPVVDAMLARGGWGGRATLSDLAAGLGPVRPETLSRAASRLAGPPVLTGPPAAPPRERSGGFLGRLLGGVAFGR
jgi:hypothetical protein